MAVIANHCPNIKVEVVDNNKDRIDKWNSNDLDQLPIYEPGLKKIIKNCRGHNLNFSTNVSENISKADMIFISVNTPTKEKGIGAGKASNLKWIESCTREISRHARGETIVVEKSTLPVRTAEVIKKILEVADKFDTHSNERTFSVLSNPEFLAEGTAINDLENPDRVLIGGEDEKSIHALIEIYSNWVDPKKILTTDLWSSELAKLTSNAFLAQRISSINSISALCESTGADIKDVSLAIGKDSRIGEGFLNSGPGFGGSCFKKDILNLVYICDHYGLKEVASYWQKVVDINNWQQKRIIKIVVESLFKNISGKKIAILGFAFKAKTNDTRESPSKVICKELLEEGANLHIYDPKVNREQISRDLEIEESNSILNFKTQDGIWRFSQDINKTIENSDAVILMTEWEEFRNLDWKYLNKIMRSPSWLFDTRAITNLKLAKESGINVWSVGNGK